MRVYTYNNKIIYEYENKLYIKINHLFYFIKYIKKIHLNYIEISINKEKLFMHDLLYENTILDYIKMLSKINNFTDLISKNKIKFVILDYPLKNENIFINTIYSIKIIYIENKISFSFEKKDLSVLIYVLKNRISIIEEDNINFTILYNNLNYNLFSIEKLIINLKEYNKLELLCNVNIENYSNLIIQYIDKYNFNYMQ